MYQAAYKIGNDKYLVIQESGSEDGFDYSIYRESPTLRLVDGGFLENAGLTAKQALAKILQFHDMSKENLTHVPFDDLMERIWDET